MLRVVPVYAALLGLLFLVLSLRVILARRGRNVGFGDAGDDGLLRRIRVQANFAEYVPLALVLLGIADARGASAVALHILCIALVVGRLAHAIGLSSPATDEAGRIVGMSGTQTAILGGAVLILLN